MSKFLKAPIYFVMAFVLAFNSVALAGKNSDVEEVKRRLEQIDPSKMTLPELEAGLKELRAKMGTLQDDLDKAEKKADNRLAVKVRNYSALGIAGLAALAIVSESRCKGPDCGGAAMSLFIFGPIGVAFVLGTQGYIYLTNGELRELKSVVKDLEKKIDRVINKIEQRRAENAA